MKNGRNRQEVKTGFILLVTAAMLLMSILAGAETVTWNNVSGGLWNAYTNWTPVGVPVPGDNVVVNNAGANTVLLNSAATINTLTIGDDSNLTLGSGQLTLTSAIPMVLYNLTISKAGDGSGTVKSLPAVIDCGTSCNAVFEKGSIVTLTANPSAGSLFNGWTGGDCTGTDVCYATMNADTNIIATFTNFIVPSASFTASPSVNLNVKFTDTSTGDPTSWLWNFGDGATSTLQNPIHTYLGTGTFNVSLTAFNSYGSDTKSVMITVTSTTADLLLSPVPANELGEAITVLANRPASDAIPNVAANVNTFVNDVSGVFAKTTPKRYSLDSFKTYTDAEFAGIATNPAFFKDNAYPSNSRYGGTTIVYYLYNNVSELPALFTSFGHAFMTFTSIGGKTYGLIYRASYAPWSELIGRVELSKLFPTRYDSSMYGFCHELGHTMGLGSPEWYGVTLTDNSEILPNLGSYSLRAAYPMDPMTSPVTWNGIQFNAFNSWLISNNANHQIDMWQVFSNLPKVIKVRIVDALGNPVSGASVKVYEALKNQVAPGGTTGLVNYYVQTDMSLPEALLQDTLSDANGEVVITRDFSTRLAKMIKAWSGAKSGGVFMEVVELEEQWWKYWNIDSYTKTITVQ